MSHLLHHAPHVIKHLAKEHPEATFGGLATGAISAIVATETVAVVGGTIATGAGAAASVVGTTGIMGSLGTTLTTVAVANPLGLGILALAGLAGGVIYLIKN